jgi:predicted Zn-dependent protease
MRIVDPVNAVSLPGVGLDLPEAEKIALRRQREGRLGEAAKALRQALKLAPGQSLIERNLASVLLDDHQAVEAAALYRRSLIRQPRMPAGPIDEREKGS